MHRARRRAAAPDLAHATLSKTGDLGTRRAVRAVLWSKKRAQPGGVARLGTTGRAARMHARTSSVPGVVLTTAALPLGGCQLASFTD